MRSFIRVVAVLLLPSLGVALGACGTERILSADFDSFPQGTTGTGFAGDLPGSPEGDSIAVPHPGDGLSLVANGPAPGGNNLRFVNTPPFSQPNQMAFGVSGHEAADRYRIVWVGAVDDAPTHTDFSFIDTDLEEGFRINIVGPLFSLVVSGTGGQEIPLDPSSSHEVLVVLDVANGTATIRVEESSGAVHSLEDLPLAASFGELGFIRLSSPHGTGEGAYFLAHINAVAIAD